MVLQSYYKHGQKLELNYDDKSTVLGAFVTPEVERVCVLHTILRLLIRAPFSAINLLVHL